MIVTNIEARDPRNKDVAGPVARSWATNRIRGQALRTGSSTRHQMTRPGFAAKIAEASKRIRTTDNHEAIRIMD